MSTAQRIIWASHRRQRSARPTAAAHTTTATAAPTAPKASFRRARRMALPSPLEHIADCILT